ncbi:hypothetical protein ECG_09086 [Echinococcus granulosus]|uniref:Expressed protein n=1 Tax=Echinococcus granulosus TaxID=6210 RepID=A0A068WUQ0_ECHGR|nr:hypothetical protein ECG_09086 [Echinococcus granulosus]CDS21319.1 expressed protein [Echinococcus granulosus]
MHITMMLLVVRRRVTRELNPQKCLLTHRGREAAAAGTGRWAITGAYINLGITYRTHAHVRTSISEFEQIYGQR